MHSKLPSYFSCIFPITFSYYVRNEEIKEKSQKFKLDYLESMNVK